MLQRTMLEQFAASSMRRKGGHKNVGVEYESHDTRSNTS
jgi:hypothetical protein